MLAIHTHTHTHTLCTHTRSVVSTPYLSPRGSFDTVSALVHENHVARQWEGGWGALLFQPSWAAGHNWNWMISICHPFELHYRTFPLSGGPVWWWYCYHEGPVLCEAEKGSWKLLVRFLFPGHLTLWEIVLTWGGGGGLSCLFFV